MIEKVVKYQCKCDKCGKETSVIEKSEIKDAGWVEVGERLLCDTCYNYHKNIKPDVDDQIVCLIDDESRHLEEGEVYQVNETVYNNESSTVDQKDRDNLAIYVRVGNGWQAKLLLGQYDV